MPKKLTPMQVQYNKIKDDYKDSIVLFRLGDFYECFNDDAKDASKILGITLTGRGKGEDRYPMAGIPHHALKNYLPKLVKAGRKVVIADQTEEAVPGQLVERQVAKVITPGTFDADEIENNFLACINLIDNNFHLAYADLSTGEFKLFETLDEKIFVNEVQKLNPSQVIVKNSDSIFAKENFDFFIEEIDDADFKLDENFKRLTSHFEVKSLSGFGINDESKLIIPAGIIIKYLNETQKTSLNHINSIKKYNYSDYMQLDLSTIRNLELIYPIQNNADAKLTFLGTLNDCKTSMGFRKLKNYVLRPLINKDMIEDRQEVTDFFYNNPIVTDDIRKTLQNIYDIERLASRLGLSSINPKDLIALVESISLSNSIFKELDDLDSDIPRFKFFNQNLNYDDLKKFIEKVKNSIDDDAPASINEGGIFKSSFNDRIKELREIKNNSKKYLAEIRERESKRTGIPSLKISFNKVFGYYIEVTKTHTAKVPDDYIRKQTLANAERFITDELKQLEEKILNSEEELINLELELYTEFIKSIQKYIDSILTIADFVAEIDVLSNFGYLSRQNSYTKPEFVDDSKIVEIENGRHLVVEQLEKEYIANSTSMSDAKFVHLLTGPNMSGKSTYIRQVALISLMAQIGCFVPAESIKLNIVDRIFTRVGASDNLAKGESTFMVEMVETANILNNATSNSLIILDEVGRGTSTYDGVAIAWSIIEFIVEKIKARTLFATHYHELTDLEDKFSQVENYNVEVIDDGDSVEFRHKIVKGSTDKSYGVHVANLAGIPAEVIKRSDEILKSFEKSNVRTGRDLSAKKTSPDKKDKSTKNPRSRKISDAQMELLG